MTYIAAENRYERIPYRRVGRSGLVLPALSMGLWHNFGDSTPIDTQRAMLRTAFDLGINHFDLANNYGPPYGSAEINFGRLLKEDFKQYRDELIISSKAGWDMWPGPYGQGGGHASTCSPASTRACSAWDWTTSIFSIPTASTRTPRWRKPRAH
jgi:L-glyceraldehyde 3-phosphate reductase